MIQVKNQILPSVMTASAIILGIGGLMTVNAWQQSSFHTAAVYMMCSLALILSVYLCKYQVLLNAAPFLMGAEIILLLLCPVLAYPIQGAKRYLWIGNFSLQPAQFAMPVLCLFWAYIFHKTQNRLSKKHWILLAAATLLTAGLVFIQVFYSMAGFIAFLGFILCILAGCSRKKILILSAILLMGTAALSPIVCNSKPLADQKDFYRRIWAPDHQKQYHCWSVLTTLKHSVFCGKHHGPSQGRYHIPGAIHDSALIAGCGQYGYLFLFSAMTAMTAILVCGSIISGRCSHLPDRLLAGGMTAVMALPAVTHTLMMLGLMPIGGVNYPFLSYGFTAGFANAFALGCILCVAKKIHSNGNDGNDGTNALKV